MRDQTPDNDDTPPPTDLAAAADLDQRFGDLFPTSDENEPPEPKLDRDDPRTAPEENERGPDPGTLAPSGETSPDEPRIATVDLAAADGSQPSLPGAEAVRRVELLTPLVAELPFTLTRPASTAPEAIARDLFAGLTTFAGLIERIGGGQ